ncbi:GntR family transcriptional regulator [Salinicoccus sp. ID82-1]|uniref:GntR family transcriptional regulator n=1 Tax=Salinicoccus cyprini TaxID=2493691 RepID=A0A558AR00_9STAP|nr:MULTISPECIES: GntR family transcriptional regulator [Salinicoccus]MCG1010252.1 GntR family transcriptional regulator [Salinicoccus sp. ID82-1]TVT26694.1 GntR family transcriptional regulator [Salinicoccus cyprini]
MINLDLKSRIPIYEQLIDRIKQLIIQGVIKPDEKLPSVRNLAQELTINPNTIQKAYRELEREGYIYSLPGKGSFVSEVKAQENDLKIQELTQDFKRIVSELLYLGTSKERLIALIQKTVEEGRKKDETRD